MKGTIPIQGRYLGMSITCVPFWIPQWHGRISFKPSSKQASRGEFLHHHMADVWHLYSSAANDTRNPPSRFSQILAMTQDELANHELLMREEDLEHFGGKKSWLHVGRQLSTPAELLPY